MIERKIEFTFSSGEFARFRSTEVLKYLADEVEEYSDHFIIRYSEDKDFVIYQLLVLLWEHGIVSRNFTSF